jgi:hypothetical protein
MSRKARGCEERANETSDFIRKKLLWLAREWHELANGVEGSSRWSPSSGKTTGGSVPRGQPMKGQASGRGDFRDFSPLCESIKDLPPKEQQSRLREHFGIFGGARPAKRPRKK